LCRFGRLSKSQAGPRSNSDWLVMLLPWIVIYDGHTFGTGTIGRMLALARPSRKAVANVTAPSRPRVRMGDTMLPKGWGQAEPSEGLYMLPTARRSLVFASRGRSADGSVSGVLPAQSTARLSGSGTCSDNCSQKESQRLS
jgi:hypothetical protein